MFYTGELARLKRVEAELKLEPQDRDTYQQLKVGKQGIAGDEGGHLAATILNGSGEKINLIPMNANLNRSIWKQMENTWVKALQEGKTVKVKIEPVYNGTDIRPDRFRVEYQIDSNFPVRETFKNRVGGK